METIKMTLDVMTREKQRLRDLLEVREAEVKLALAMRDKAARDYKATSDALSALTTYIQRDSIEEVPL